MFGVVADCWGRFRGDVSGIRSGHKPSFAINHLACYDSRQHLEHAQPQGKVTLESAHLKVSQLRNLACSVKAPKSGFTR